jgi:hypothetical protein
LGSSSILDDFKLANQENLLRGDLDRFNQLRAKIAGENIGPAFRPLYCRCLTLETAWLRWQRNGFCQYPHPILFWRGKFFVAT